MCNYGENSMMMKITSKWKIQDDKQRSLYIRSAKQKKINVYNNSTVIRLI